MNNLLWVFILFLISCSDASQVAKKKERQNVELVDKVFFFGPRLDSIKTEVLAECDCCRSDILFNNDSSFIAVYYCLDGDSYAKGKFSVIGNKLTLNFAPMEVTKPYNLEAEFDSSEYINTSRIEVVNRKIPSSVIHISSLNGKIVLVTTGKEKDYGIESKDRGKASFTNSLKKDSVLHYLKID